MKILCTFRPCECFIVCHSRENPAQLAKTFLNLLNQISKDQTIQYLLTLLDDVLQVN